MRDGVRRSIRIAPASGWRAAARTRGAASSSSRRSGRSRPARKYVDVDCRRGTSARRRVIVTTGTATAEFKPLRRHFKRRETLSRDDRAGAGRDAQAARRRGVVAARHCGRRAPHPLDAGRSSRVGGADQDETPARTRDAVLVQRTGQLMYELLTMYPAISGLQPEFGWDAAVRRDRRRPDVHRRAPQLSASPVRARRRRRLVTGAFVAARILLRAVHGEAEKADEVFGWTR